MAKYNNIKLTKHRNRLKAIIGKQECFTDEMISFPVERLDGVVAVEVETNKRNLIVFIKLESGETFPLVPQVKEQPVMVENTSRPIQPGTNRPPQPPAAPDPTRKPARAPYNFVQLGAKMVEGESAKDFSRFGDGLLTGYIQLEITAKTDIFTRGERENFFKINNEYVIPGSTLRGLTRSMVEMVGFGRLGIFDDKRLYNRSMAEPEKSGIRQYYNEMRGNADGDRIKPGYLNFDRNEKKYYIIPIAEGKLTKVPNSFSQKPFKYDFSQGTYRVISGWMNNKKKDWKFALPSDEEKKKENWKWIDREDEDDYLSDKTRNAEGLMQDILDTAKNKKDEFREGVPMFYSTYVDAAGKERTAIGHTKFFRIPYHRTIGNAIPKSKEKDTVDLAERIFGRVNMIDKPDENGKRREPKPDDIIAGRVFFEDALCNQKAENVGSTLSPLQVLSNPKATAFQLYLEQTTDQHNYQTSRNNLLHWGSNNGKIRGNKLYWHNKNAPWKNERPAMTSGPFELIADKQLKVEFSKLNEAEKKKLMEYVFDDPKKKAQFTIAKVLHAGTSFNGRIRFENLTEIELGALLFALQLPEGCCHKLGMGKPLGLGSVQMTPKLVLTNRNKQENGRYSSLFNGNTWNLGSETVPELGTYKNCFSNYVISKLGDGNLNALWEHPRMKELKEMLTFEHGDANLWNKKTRYMTLKDDGNPYRNRWVLPKPSVVVGMGYD